VSKRKVNFVCNDCDRRFTNASAWEYHGQQTGHNLDGDLPGHEAQKIVDLDREVMRLTAELKESKAVAERLHTKLTGIVSILNL